MRLRRPWAIHQLRHHPQAVLLIHPQRVGIQVVLRLKLTKLKTCATVFDRMTQDTQGAERAQGAIRCIRIDLIELRRHSLQELCGGVTRVELGKLLPLLRLCLLHKAKYILLVEPNSRL